MGENKNYTEFVSDNQNHMSSLQGCTYDLREWRLNFESTFIISDASKCFRNLYQHKVDMHTKNGFLTGHENNRYETTAESPNIYE